MPKSFQKVAKKVSIPVFLHKKRMPKSIRYYNGGVTLGVTF